MDEYLQIVDKISALTPRVKISALNSLDEQIFLNMTKESLELYAPWVFPPRDPAAFQELLKRNTQDNFETVVVRPIENQEIIGIFNLSQIFYHDFKNTILGVYANVDYQGQGLMREGLLQAVAYVFFKLKLHRIEANIMCENQRSIKFFKNFGFRHEGMSKNYLYINGAWRDHDKFALTIEDWENILLNFKQAKHAKSD